MLNKSIAVMQPYFLPYIGYFQLLNAVDEFVFYDDVNFINRGWINRNYILINGEKKLITVPLLGSSQNKLINEIEVEKNEKWRLKMLQMFYMSYKRAPFFNEIYLLIENCFNDIFSTISDLNILIIEKICDYLQITNKSFKLSSNLNNKYFKSSERILNICKIEGANHYINPIGGLELYEKDDFFKNNVKLSFLKTDDIIYKQFKNSFIPNLSIIDILMFCRIDQVQEFLSKYYLTEK